MGCWIWVSLKTKDQEKRLVGVEENEESIHPGIKQQASLPPHSPAGCGSEVTEWTWIGELCGHIEYTKLIKVCWFFSVVENKNDCSFSPRKADDLIRYRVWRNDLCLSHLVSLQWQFGVKCAAKAKLVVVWWNKTWDFTHLKWLSLL